MTIYHKGDSSLHFILERNSFDHPVPNPNSCERCGSSVISGPVLLSPRLSGYEKEEEEEEEEVMVER
ncbi:hypothetical protein E2C01_082298 [Portunus trituberculatus]|uniref:Uncharacterized protein n=1 Tax=Portunus trituberculatus TaxID=210409 RepID=A0A5B7J0G2_PORTR|nr:hypothetical protein [Portunus trituberculatus]